MVSMAANDASMSGVNQGFERAPCVVDAELDLAAEETVGAQPSENEIGIGDGGLGAAESVAHRAGLGTRASRPNVQRAHVRARDRAAAGADLLDIDHRD